MNKAELVSKIAELDAIITSMEPIENYPEKKEEYLNLVVDWFAYDGALHKLLN